MCGLLKPRARANSTIGKELPLKYMVAPTYSYKYYCKTIKRALKSIFMKKHWKQPKQVPEEEMNDTLERLTRIRMQLIGMIAFLKSLQNKPYYGQPPAISTRYMYMELENAKRNVSHARNELCRITYGGKYDEFFNGESWECGWRYKVEAKL